MEFKRVRSGHAPIRDYVSHRNPMIRIANWNVEWATPTSPRGRRVAAMLAARAADLICMTEGYEGLLPEGGHVITAQPDYGYPLKKRRRKVLLWSREPWHEVDCIGCDTLPSGRYVSGTTETPIGPINVVGVCIPWRDAHVRTGRSDRDPWQDHVQYLRALPHAPAWSSGSRTVVVGDFNQRVPRARAPERVFAHLEETFDGFEIPTSGALQPLDRQTVDHVALRGPLSATRVSAWAAQSEDGRRLSDHFGVAVEVAATRT